MIWKRVGLIIIVVILIGIQFLNSDFVRIQKINRDLRGGFSEKVVGECFRLLRRASVKNKDVPFAIVEVFENVAQYIENNNVEMNSMAWRKLMAMYQSVDYRKDLAVFLKVAIKANRAFEAIDLLEDEEFFKLTFKNSAYFKIYALSLWQRKRADSALFLFKKYLDLDPDDFDSAYQYMLMSYMSKDFDRAVNMALELAGKIQKDQGLNDAVSYGWIYYILGKRREAEGDCSEAIPLYSRAIDADPWHVMSYHALIRSYQECGRSEDVFGVEEKLSALKPRFFVSGELAEKKGILGFSYDDLDLEMGGETFIILFLDPKIFPGNIFPKCFLLFNSISNPQFNLNVSTGGLPFGYSSIDEGYLPARHVVSNIEGFKALKASLIEEGSPFVIRSKIHFPEREKILESVEDYSGLLFGGSIRSVRGRQLLKLLFRKSRHSVILSFGRVDFSGYSKNFFIKNSADDLYVVILNPNKEFDASLFLQESVHSSDTEYHHILLMELPSKDELDDSAGYVGGFK